MFLMVVHFINVAKKVYLNIEVIYTVPLEYTIEAEKDKIIIKPSILSQRDYEKMAKTKLFVCNLNCN